MSDWAREEYVHEHTCDNKRACGIFCPIELERIAEYFGRDTIEWQRIDRRKIVGRPERKAALIEELIEIGSA